MNIKATVINFRNNHKWSRNWWVKTIT